MIKTLEILRKDKKTFWLIKIHPSSYIFKDEIDLILKKVNKFKSDNISILKKKTDNLYLITSADIIITGRGTVALESAIFGKKQFVQVNLISQSLEYVSFQKILMIMRNLSLIIKKTLN